MLEERVAKLEERLSRIEALLEGSARAGSMDSPAGLEETDFGDLMLSPLKQVMEQDQAKTGILFAGILKGEQSWANFHTSKTIEAEQVDYQEVAQLTAPFSSPQRIAILHALAGGSLTSSQLEERSGLTGGQLYHHLKELKTASLVSQDGRGEYRLTKLGQMEFMAFSLLATTRRHYLKKLK